MTIIEVWAWDEKIADFAQDGNKVQIDLTDERHRRLSPLLFENINSKSVITPDGSSVDEIGLIADTLPGKHGRDYLDRYFMDDFGRKPSIIERLAFVGSHGLGALEFRPASDASDIDTERCMKLDTLRTVSRSVEQGEHDLDISKLIAISNSAAGGARPKAVVGFDPDSKQIHIAQKHDKEPEGYVKCIVKFNNREDARAAEAYNEELRAEYVYYLLAKEAGMNVSPSWLVRDNGREFYITQRFDVQNGERLHMASLAGLFSHDASSFSMGYESLFRMGNMLSVSAEDKRQAFKNMAFNLVFGNRDDHSRNFSYLMNRSGSWSYAPAYDLTFSDHNYGERWHQLTIDKKPAHQVRGLAMQKIAKIAGIKDYKEIFEEMIDLKHTLLRTLCIEYSLRSGFYNELCDLTKGIDALFGAKKEE